MPIEVRPASEADVDAILSIHEVVQKLMADLAPDKVKPAVDPEAGRRMLAAQLRHPKSRIAIAVSDGVPLGYVWFDIRAWQDTPMMRARTFLMVQNLAVKTTAQRQGVGTALMHYVEQEAAQLGIDEVNVGHWTVNAEAERFYAALGYSMFTSVLAKNVQSGPAKVAR
jgi:GNAT superfamily N-acetyltransferase